MQLRVDKKPAVAEGKAKAGAPRHLADARFAAVQLKQLQAMADASPNASRLRALQGVDDGGPPDTLCANKQTGWNSSPPVQRMIIRAPALPPEYDANTGQTTTYDDAEMEIDTDAALTAHVPDIPPSTNEFFQKKLGLAWNAHYMFDPFAQQAITNLRQHLKRLNVTRGYGATQLAQRTNINNLYQALVAPNHANVVASFQGLILAKFGARVAEIISYAPLYSAQITALLTELTAVTASKQARDGNTSLGKSTFYADLAATAVAAHDVPDQNLTVTETDRTRGAYTVGATKEVWVSVHGARGGQDVYGWPPTSDLNYKYGLVHAPTKKLVAGHLLPAWLGGMPTNANLTPITNEANGWLTANAERDAKSAVFSAGSCLKYEVACTFGLAVAHPIEADVAALVPSTFAVTLTALRWSQNADPKNWANYATNGAARTYNVPGPTLGLDYARMGAGISRQDLDRNNLQEGMR